MILKISTNKGRYDKGQVFPFLIAILVVVIIITMITVNLGQIGIFKTDVSNAADAGALAGASTLSGYLLGIGLQSDQMCGFMIIELVIIILAICTVIEIPIAIADAIATFIKQMVGYFKALNDGKMAWSNAKKAALQYAFSNAGIDEPRPTFKQFVQNVYGKDADSLTSAEVATYNNAYSLGDDPSADPDMRKNIKQYSQSGFSRFMEESRYWDESAWGKIEPGTISPAIVTAGYGWSVDNQGEITNSYESYTDYDNYVEVQVVGNVVYPLELYNPIGQVFEDIGDWIAANLDDIWWLEWLGDVVSWVLNLVGGIIETLLPGGLKMDPIKSNTDNNPITVTVRRFKRNNDLGLWTFRYGTVEAAATAHVYGEDDGDGVAHDIKPSIGKALECDVFGLAGMLWCAISRALDGHDPMWDWFDTKKHLFESELTGTR